MESADFCRANLKEAQQRVGDFARGETLGRCRRGSGARTKKRQAMWSNMVRYWARRLELMHADIA